VKRAIAYIVAIIILLIFNVLQGINRSPQLSIKTWESVTTQYVLQGE
jgi:hypothetical protein